MKIKIVLPIIILCLGAIALIAQVTSIQGLTGVITINPGSGLLLTPAGQNLALSADTAVMLSQASAIAGTPWQAVDAGGSGTVYSTTTVPALTAYQDGMMLLFRPNTACGGGVTTLNIDALGAKAIVQPDGSSNPTAGECVAKITIPITYNASLKGGAGAWVLPR